MKVTLSQALKQIKTELTTEYPKGTKFEITHGIDEIIIEAFY